MKCDKCDFEAKNANGLRLHMKKHKDPQVAEQGRPVRIKLFDNKKLVLSYPVLGERAVEEAKINAQKRGYEIQIER